MSRRAGSVTAPRVAAALAGALALGLAGCASYAPPPAPPLAALRGAQPPPVTAYLVYNGFHSGLTVPAAALRAHPGPTTQALGRLAPQPWTSLGYGDAKFYQHQGIDFGRALDFVRSMLKPGNPSVVHLAGMDDPLRDPSHPHLLRLEIPAARFGDLVRRVDASFALDAGGRPQFIAHGQGGAGDQFFRGERPASAIHECNQWIGDVLGAAGVAHTPLLDTTTYGLALDLQTSGHGAPVVESAATGPTGTSPGAAR